MGSHPRQRCPCPPRRPPRERIERTHRAIRSAAVTHPRATGRTHAPCQPATPPLARATGLPPAGARGRDDVRLHGGRRLLHDASSPSTQCRAEDALGASRPGEAVKVTVGRGREMGQEATALGRPPRRAWGSRTRPRSADPSSRLRACRAATIRRVSSGTGLDGPARSHVFDRSADAASIRLRQVRRSTRGGVRQGNRMLGSAAGRGIKPGQALGARGSWSRLPSREPRCGFGHGSAAHHGALAHLPEPIATAVPGALGAPSPHRWPGRCPLRFPIRPTRGLTRAKVLPTGWWWQTGGAEA
jgi:hypothetical protein